MAIKSYLLSAITAIALTQCTYHNEDDYFKDNPDICYTDNVTFGDDVFPVMQQSCISCHNNNNASGGIDLSDYENVKKQAEQGSLLGSIKHEETFSPMPKFSDKLPDCTISKIEAWIEQGTKNN
jgi:mono/diheme cytochrome c family protein